MLVLPVISKSFLKAGNCIKLGENGILFKPLDVGVALLSSEGGVALASLLFFWSLYLVKALFSLEALSAFPVKKATSKLRFEADLGITAALG